VARTLLVFAHPALEKSRVHRRFLAEAAALSGIEVRDLYELYPDFDVDVEAEQRSLAGHDLVIVQHPLYWYSVPPLLKQWIDLVLEHGWAYGARGTALAGKGWLEIVSAGGPRDGYRTRGFHGLELRQFLAPLERTARLCGMDFLPPWALFGTHRLSAAELERAARAYRRLLEAVRDDRVDWAAAARFATLEEALASDATILAPAVGGEESTR